MQQQISFKYLLALAFIIAIKITNAQNNSAFTVKNTVYAEGATQGPVYSINYDHIFSEGSIFAKSYRAGLSVYGDVFAVPVGINFISGKKEHHAEFGITFIPYIEKYQKLFTPGNLSDKKMYIMPQGGYRYQKPQGGFFFKAVAGPILYLDPPSDNFWNMDPKLYAGISIGAGYSF